ncbi:MULTISPECIES: cupin domain-containing protein [Halorussus]|uniref:cupin domain-containing protein n=1 Tax=Halorussus TaxID=1070314 RepID=UPI0020A03B91|nr:cupin domain-containing protein [Halorussus vallis]USZ77825.1 cupin domain-containing protein [Halorussus vallis]
MYEKTSLSDLETREVEDVEPRLKAVGYELRPEKMRPSVWEFEAGESNNRHRQREQEELYYVVDGEFSMTVESEAGDRDTFDLDAGDVVVVPPESWRQLEAKEAGTVLVVGAPNAKDDAVTEE